MTQLTLPSMPGVIYVEDAPDGSSDEFYTPACIRELLPPIDLDPCSPPHRPIKAKEHYVLSEGNDGLALPWHGIVFCNPPYSAPNLTLWTEKCQREIESMRCDAIIALIPARPGAAYWQEHIWKDDGRPFVGWWPGRIAFDTINGPGTSGGTFDSALVVWRRPRSTQARVNTALFLRDCRQAGVAWTRLEDEDLRLA